MWQAGDKRRGPIPPSGGHLNTSSSDASQPTTHCLGADTQQPWSPQDPGKAEGMFLLAREPGRCEKWIRECKPCQYRNSPPQKPQALLGTITAEYPFQKLSWDIMGPLPASSKGHRYNLVVMDLFTKWVEAFPLQFTESTVLATVLVDEIVCRYGVPTIIHSGQSANLAISIIHHLCLLLGMERTRTTVYHPKGNVQVKRFNCTLEAMLAKVVQANQQDWDAHLPKVLFAYRIAIHESTHFTPYHLTFGHSPMLPVHVMLGRHPSELV